MRILLCTGLCALVAPLLLPALEPGEPEPTTRATVDLPR